jgi:hypothetical protein
MRRSALLLSVVAISISGCASAPAQPSAAELVGTWTVQVDVGTQATVNFDADGTYSAHGLGFPQLNGDGSDHTWTYEPGDLVLEVGRDYGEQLLVERSGDGWQICETEASNCAGDLWTEG